VGVSEYVAKRYETAIRLHFSGDLGALKAKTVEYEDVVRWLKWMEEKGLASKTIANHHGLLSSAFGTAVRMRIRPNNPVVGIRLPKSRDTEDTIRFMTPEEWARIAANLKAHYVPFFQFLLGSGLRFSEATVLTAKDFKLDGVPPTVRVSKAWKQDKANGFYVGPPKTKKSRRTVSLAPSTIATVRPLVEGAGDGLVFRQVKGGAIRSSQAWKEWGPACLAAGYAVESRPRIHDIRHSHASWMINAGMDMFQLSHRLGHESVTTTLDRYSHLMPEAHFTGASIAAKALGG
jgi:integrase